MKHRLKRLIFAAAFAAGISNFAAPAVPAAAHADIVSTEPAAGSTIAKQPERIRVAFDEKLQPVGTRIRLFDAQNKEVTLEKGAIDPADPRAFIVPLPKLTSGAYTVQWTALSEDGHSEKGSYAFTLRVPNVTGDVTLRFALKAGKDVVACGKEMTGLGSKRSSAQISDARFHVSNVRLLDSAGKEVPVALTPDGKWQSDSVALIDFEDASGLCKDGGTAETRVQIKGKAEAGAYTGVVFDLGVPFAMNHADVATAKSPLNVKAMWWNWQGGYKFLRVDFKSNAPAPQDTFFVHLGSTGCGEIADPHSALGEAVTATHEATGTMAVPNMAPEKPCANANIPTVRLMRFDPARDVIVADVGALLRGVDLSNPTPMPAGCMSGVDDKDCVGLFPNLGLSLKTGACASACRNQRLFRVEPALAIGQGRD